MRTSSRLIAPLLLLVLLPVDAAAQRAGAAPPRVDAAKRAEFYELTAKANRLSKAHAYAEALVALEKAQALVPFARTLLQQGKVLLKLGRPREALDKFRLYEEAARPLTPAQRSELAEYRRKAQAAPSAGGQTPAPEARSEGRSPEDQDGLGRRIERSTGTGAERVTPSANPEPGPDRVAALRAKCQERGRTYDLCDGTCVNLSRDSANCGFCGEECPGDSTCMPVDGYGAGGRTGVCLDERQKCHRRGFGYDYCWDGCINNTRDPDNCGRCGNKCTETGRCDSGQCVMPDGSRRY